MSQAIPARGMGVGSRPRRAWVLTLLLGAVGVAAIVIGGWDADWAFFADPLMWALAVGFCVTEVWTIDLPFKSHRHSYSMAEIPAIVGLFFLEPSALILSSMIGMGAAFLGVRRQLGLKLVFNMCLQLAVVALQLLVFGAIAASKEPTDASAIVAVYVAITATAVVSHVAVFSVISFMEGVWDKVLFGAGLIFGIGTQVTNASLGLIAVFLIDLDPRAFAILLLPLIVMYRAYQSLGKQVRAEERLRVSELRFGALIRASSDVTALVGSDLMLDYVSDASREVLGVAPSELRGRPVTDLFDADEGEIDNLLLHLEQAEGSAEPVVFDLACRHRSGDEIQLEVNLTDLLFEPAVVGILMSIRDVTDRRRLEERLTQSQKMDAIGQLAGGIAHDFNNLLAVIQNYASFVKDDLPPTSPSAQDVDEIIGATQTASTLTQQLLSFARKEMIAPKVVSPNEIVTAAHRMLARTIEESIDVRIALGSDVPNVKIDPGRLEQVLINLAVNAKDAMADGGTLIFGTARTTVGPSLASSDMAEGDYVVITVEDTGRGIPVELRERIFEPFFTTKLKGHGTGLGLATVYGIVKQFGGSIEVESEVGRGSTFKIYLPVADAAELGENASSTIPNLAGTGTILVAEDSEPLRKLVRRILTNNSYSVVEAASGVEAFHIWQERAPEIDLLVTDVVMPRMSGRELSEVTGLPTVFVSGYTDEILSQSDIDRTGFFLQKPFSAAELLAVVAEALAATTRSDRSD